MDLREFPLEVLVDVLKYLSPINLFFISYTCQFFYKLLLNEQEIWKFSRKNHMVCRKLNPPLNMKERDYLKLLLGYRCYNRCYERNTMIYWEVNIRLCSYCYTNSTCTRDEMCKRFTEKLWLKEIGINKSELPFYDNDFPYPWNLIPFHYLGGNRYFKAQILVVKQILSRELKTKKERIEWIEENSGEKIRKQQEEIINRQREDFEYLKFINKKIFNY
ncbi:4358_t:CDS:1 [Scutellospora calospora]|uniref:4358_t:CDS:1 n=1 Tax=Scutellospora calospora TaxID=85575 RepID=A0ACA9JXU0_9GLOM|nr:4358_t:CDS:1 [Scutellospora calospora]